MKLQTELFEAEGKQNVRSVIRIVAKASKALEIRKVVVFASAASNVLALREVLSENTAVLVVTFPSGMVARRGHEDAVLMGIPSREDRQALRQRGIPILQGVMPLRALGETLSPSIDAMRRVFSLWGGGTELCVQAVLMASDAGYLSEGEQCLVMTGDTALIMRAGNAYNFLRAQSKVAIEHVLCKPLHYQITRESATVPEVPKTVNVTPAKKPAIAASKEEAPAPEEPGSAVTRSRRKKA
jgi:hypothetical protein